MFNTETPIKLTTLRHKINFMALVSNHINSKNNFRMRILRLAVLALGLTLSATSFAQSRSLTAGYRGFVDAGIHAGTVKDGVSDDLSFTRIGFTTTHGYQFNEHIFAGVGFGYQIQAGDDLIEDFDLLMPAYGAFRYDFRSGNVSPFASARIGCYAGLSGESDNSVFGSYINVNAGVRLRRLNLSVGYEAMPATATLEGYDYDIKANSFVFRIGVDLGPRD